MAVSVFDLFKVGIGPSSSHTVGPMRAARLFAQSLAAHANIHHVEVDLLGALGATGRGHSTDTAVMLGLMGHAPETVDVDAIEGWLGEVTRTGLLPLLGIGPVPWHAPTHLRFLPAQRLAFHPNAMVCRAFDAQGQLLLERTHYSVGGGFVVGAEVADNPARAREVAPDADVLPRPFHSAAQLLRLCEQHGCSMAELMRHNEQHWRPQADIDQGLLGVWSVMQGCIERGLQRPVGSCLPGSLKVPRRAPALWQRLQASASSTTPDALAALDHVNLWAMAVNEENASGSRVVTAPTNGAAGIVPAVLMHMTQAWSARPSSGLSRGSSSDQAVIDFLLTAGAVGMLYKENASISGAEVGCQGEVGVACSMAAAGLCAAWGGTPAQVENAAEIGMEHHLGLTCDPVGGLVQIPCIERNALAAVQAINAARLALHGDGRHHVSLDQVIETMRQTGADMKSHYKETSLGGLAVNVVLC
jgi:L-serine dehydratase